MPKQITIDEALLVRCFNVIHAEGHYPDDKDCSRCELLKRIETVVGRKLTKDRGNNVVGLEVVKRRR